MTKPMSDERLQYAGFKPHKKSRIHVFCTKCGRKYSNMPMTEYDPPNAVLAQIWCDKCSDGCKDNTPDYLDAHGNFLDWETGEVL